MLGKIGVEMKKYGTLITILVAVLFSLGIHNVVLADSETVDAAQDSSDQVVQEANDSEAVEAAQDNDEQAAEETNDAEAVQDNSENNDVEENRESETVYTVFLPLNVQKKVQAPAQPEWLQAVNNFRAQANLPPVTENADWSEGNELHSRYMVKNDVIAHSEEKNNQWYTQEGYEAAQTSNLVVAYDSNASDVFAINSWMQAPFHALGILDPDLEQVGYGAYREANGTYQMGAGLDVIRGLGRSSSSVSYPVIWPDDGKSVELTQYWGEYPDPLSSCDGYTAPTGVPVIIQIGSGNKTPKVTAHSFSSNGSNLAHCVIDETNYNNPDSDSQKLVRSVLDARDAIVIIPREPLTPGASYSVSVTVNGQAYDWTFSVAGTRTPTTLSTQEPQVEFSSPILAQ
jgi:uncharacterized protein YkwD